MLKIKFAVMNYSKKIGNLPCKPMNKIRQNREASYCQQSQDHSLINILTKYSVVTNCK